MKINLLIFTFLVLLAKTELFAYETIPYKTSKSSTIDTFGLPEKRALPIKELNILVWNIKKAAHSHFERDYRSLINSFQIILLQEGIFNPNYQFDYLRAKNFQTISAQSFLLPFETDGTFTGVATLSKAPSVDTTYLKTIFKEPIVKTPKVTLFTTYRLQNLNKKLLVINLHAINFVTDYTYMFELRRIKYQIKKHNGPLIWAGDFNTWSQSRLRYIKKIAQNLNLKEVEIPSQFRTADIGLVLDYAFVRGVKVKSVQDLSSIRSSDHRPLSFKISITP